MLLKFQVFTKDVDKEMLLLLAARASRVENQDAIDACIVGMLGDPKEVNSSCLCFSIISIISSSTSSYANKSYI